MRCKFRQHDVSRDCRAQRSGSTIAIAHKAGERHWNLIEPSLWGRYFDAACVNIRRTLKLACNQSERVFWYGMVGA